MGPSLFRVLAEKMAEQLVQVMFAQVKLAKAIQAKERAELEKLKELERKRAFYINIILQIGLSLLIVIGLFGATKYFSNIWAVGLFAILLQVGFVLYKMREKTEAKSANTEKIEVVKPNQMLLYLSGFLFEPNNREAALGDFEEKFERACGRFGKFKANLYLAYDVFCSFLSKIKPKIIFLLKILGITSLATLLTQIQTIYKFFFNG